MRATCFAVVLLLIGAFVAEAQVLPPPDPIMPEEYDPSEFPIWAHDLRRYEIIAVGSFPMTFVVASLVYDFSTLAANNWDPAFGMGTQRGSDDIAIIIGSAAAVSVVLATVDLILNVSKRKRSEQSLEQRTVHSPDP